MNANEVFEKVVSILLARRQDIHQMARTENSFEEWINWQLWLDLQQINDGTTFSRESKYPMPPSKKPPRADLLIWNADESKILIEVALVHDGNRNKKWRNKIDGDAWKLKRYSQRNVTKLQLVIALSAKGQVLAKSAWSGWFKQINLFSRIPPTFEKSEALGPQGQLVIFGWAS